ncbi:MAG: hypothetical protein ACWA5R_00945 [bacterium]
MNGELGKYFKKIIMLSELAAGLKEDNRIFLVRIAELEKRLARLETIEELRKEGRLKDE